MIIMFLKGCFSVIKKEVIKEIDSFTNGILTEGLRLLLVMVSIFAGDFYRTFSGTF